MASDSEPIRGFGGFAPMGSKGKAPVGGLGDDVPQKLKHFCEKNRQFCSFSVNKFAFLMVYILTKFASKNQE